MTIWKRFNNLPTSRKFLAGVFIFFQAAGVAGTFSLFWLMLANAVCGIICIFGCGKYWGYLSD